MSRVIRGLAVAVVVALAARLLTWLTPTPASLIATLGHPQEAALGAGVDAVALAAAGAGCWLALSWLALALTTSAAAGLPGRCGQLADRVAAATVPAAARRLLAVTLGLTVVTATGATPAMAYDLPQPRPAGSSLDLDWPTAGDPSVSPTPSVARRPPTPSRAAERSGNGTEVVVQRGDSLWTIARRHLPAGTSDAKIAAEWPRWYAANQSAVGADPNHLLPGQRLIPPHDSSGGKP